MDGSHLIGGLEHRVIEIAEYDPAWPRRFETERRVIRDALGEAALRIEHIGSTAVPGLDAKAVIDIDVSVRDVEQESDYLAALVDAGYLLRVREPGHRLVRTPARDVHL